MNILVLCTGNSARSILAEAALNQAGRGILRAYSAGSHPAGAVNPFALRVLEARGLQTDGLRSKSWDEFARPDAPVMDVVITVCDGAAAEACPVWPGNPVRAHWGLADPSNAPGTEAQRFAAFRGTLDALQWRAERLVALLQSRPGRGALESGLREIHDTAAPGTFR